MSSEGRVYVNINGDIWCNKCKEIAHIKTGLVHRSGCQGEVFSPNQQPVLETTKTPGGTYVTRRKI